ncbi:MAG: hypothetical protein PHI79_03450 [Sulfurovaceae bacterium]|nr:hypothetical protein [Sulfurovaceae bacterium]
MKGENDEKNYLKGFMMDGQWIWIVNGLLTIAGVLLGLLYADMKKDITKQEAVLEKLADKVHDIDKVVAGEYVLKSDLTDVMKIVFDKLDKISDKLDKKADK